MLGVEAEARIAALCAQGEQADGVVRHGVVQVDVGGWCVEALNVEDAFFAHAQSRAAGDQDGESGARGHEVDRQQRAVDELLEVVENQQHGLAGEEASELRFGGFGSLEHEPDLAGDRLRDLVRVLDRVESDPVDAVGVRAALERFVGGLDREACLADAGGSEEGDEPVGVVAEEVGDGGEFVDAADERRGGVGEVVGDLVLVWPRGRRRSPVGVLGFDAVLGEFGGDTFGACGSVGGEQGVGAQQFFGFGWVAASHVEGALCLAGGGQCVATACESLGVGKQRGPDPRGDELAGTQDPLLELGTQVR